MFCKCISAIERLLVNIFCTHKPLIYSWIHIMAHVQQLFYVEALKNFFPQYFEGVKVLEIGSLNINGSVRQYFNHCQYTGLDVGPGKDVDIVCAGEDFGAPSSQYDVVISCEAMEHNPNWRLTWLNMLRMLKPDGFMVMTCASIGRRQHGTDEFNPADSPLTIAKKQNHYMNLVAEDFTALINFDEWFASHGFHNDHQSYDLYFFGLGLNAKPEVVKRAADLNLALKEYYHDKNFKGLY
jgi:SAM-dependent methyltransferase